jgi:integrase
VGDKLDESSLLAALAQYQPHRDNQTRNGKQSRQKATQGRRSREATPKATSNPTNSPTSTPELIDAFYAAHPAWAARTLEWYSRYLKPFGEAFKQLPDRPEPLEQYLAEIHKQGTPTVYAHTWRALRTLYRWAGRRYLLPNPTEQITPARTKTKLPDFYGEQELKVILEAAKATGDPQDYAMVRLFMYSGIRAGELANLRPYQVYEDHIQVNGKTGEGVVPIDPGTYEAIKPLLERGSPFVFPARTGGQFGGAEKGQKRGKGYRRQGFQASDEALHRRGLYGRVSRLIRGSGVEVKGRKTGPHVLRHSFARLMLDKTGDLRLVQRLLRHTSINTTVIYTHLAQESVNRKYQENNPAKWIED